MKQVVKKKLLVLWMLLVAIVSYAQPGTINSHKENSQLLKDFSGYQWKMKMMLPGEGVKQGLHKLPPEDIETHVWNPAKVPGDVYTDLWKAGVIEDPYFGRNSVKAQWVMQYEWWYSYQFNVTEDIGDNLVRLDFDGVDYACDVWLNGEFLGSHEGAFSSFSFDINHALRTSKKWLKSSNILMVRLAPPPQVNSRVAGKKTPWFGDYWRDLIPFGLYRPIRMVTTGKSRITDVYVNPKINKGKSATANLEIEVENTTSEAKEMSFVGTIEGKNFKSKPIHFEFTKNVQPGKQVVKEKVKIKEAKLWWPWDLGKPNLYTAKISLRENKINHDFSETTFGIREVTMKWNPGFGKDEVSFPRTTVINGKPIFIRSACWGGPPDIFVGRTTNEKYKRLIQLAKEANMNNIRIFGWHPPEIPIFYKLCDEAGITVWQDIIPLGTGNLPRDEKVLEGIFVEGEKVITERRNHPSLIMMEGGEEMFLRSGDAMFTRNFLETLGKRLQAKVDLPYVPDSPLTCETAQSAGYKSKEAVHALFYFYGMGNWLMEDWYSNLDFPIVPEFAITSVPNVESLKKFIPKDELWTPGVSWGHHWADLDRLRMQNFDTFGEERTGSLQEFVDATQDAQGTIFKLGIEHFRRRKPVTSGVSLCHFITYWPDMKWGLVDNYTKPKRSYEFVKRAYQPTLINLKFHKRRWFNSETFKGEVWIVNDLYKTFKNCTGTYTIKNDDGKVLSQVSFDVDKIKENSSAKFINLNEKVLKKVKKYFYITLELKDGKGNILSTNEYMLLIGNQKKASAEYKKKGEEVRKRNRKYTYGNYYKFYDKYSGENKEELESKTDSITTRGFDK